MRAITVVPGVTGSARLDELPEPDPAQGSLLVKALALGVCGTDREIVAGKLGAPPPDRQRLILGHESLGIVEEGPEDGGFERGDHVVAIVRLPDPVPCPACAAGEWDMCRNGQYVEHGIKERDGFGSERFRTDPRFTVKVDAGLGPLAILLEPTSIVAKAWDQIERIGRRSPSWRPHSVLVTGAGSIGLLAALIGKQRGLEVHLFDRSPEGPKPKLARGLGATYHIGDIAAVVADLEPDIIVECTGAAAIVAEVVGGAAAAGIVCLAGLSGNKTLSVDIGRINHTMVLENQVAFGTVNANRRHYEVAAETLARADHSWLAGLISRRVPLDRWMEALDDRPDDIKVVIDFTLTS